MKFLYASFDLDLFHQYSLEPYMLHSPNTSWALLGLAGIEIQTPFVLVLSVAGGTPVGCYQWSRKIDGWDNSTRHRRFHFSLSQGQPVNHRVSPTTWRIWGFMACQSSKESSLDLW
ncbi:uncharacterized protein LOC119984198 [Tripterygium wilfordii]|uniref:uncharacterized protein LOC119984198 n=1 Tax=Tripterygium wilfordii TaxID=458696 RepID=UPI0018F7FB08|nr:uncharacterized protein LOC119984198 [Tripterygium wilfordii]